jgi:hypothetical protein
MASRYRQNSQPEHIYIHGKGDWEQEALRRQRNLEYATGVVASSFIVAYNFFKGIIDRFRPPEEVIALGRYIDEYDQETDIIGVKNEELKRHLHVVGGTGRGKTTLLVNMLIQLMLMGRSLIVIDPKADLIDSLLRFIPPSRIQDVILFDPSDWQYPIAFNIFSSVKPHERPRLASEILSVVRKVTGDLSWGPRLEDLLRMTILALAEFPGATFYDLYYMLTDDFFRRTVVQRVTDTFVKEFWEGVFSSWSDAAKASAIHPVLNKITPFFAYEHARHILGQPNSSFSLRDICDSGKILLVRIPQGDIGEDLSALLAGLFLTKLDMEIRTRTNVPPELRKQVHVVVDELQNLPVESINRILSEGRSFGLSFLASHQFVGQLPTELAQSLEHNCAVKLTGHLEGNRHLVEFDLLQDIDQPKFFIRPLLPAHNPSNEIAESVRIMSRLRYGIELEDVKHQLELKHERRTQYGEAYRAQKQAEEQAQKQAAYQQKKATQTQSNHQQKKAQTQNPTAGPTRPKQTNADPDQTIGASKPQVMQHGTKTVQQPTQPAQKSGKGKRPKPSANTP